MFDAVFSRTLYTVHTVLYCWYCFELQEKSYVITTVPDASPRWRHHQDAAARPIPPAGKGIPAAATLDSLGPAPSVGSDLPLAPDFATFKAPPCGEGPPMEPKTLSIRGMKLRENDGTKMAMFLGRLPASSPQSPLW